LSKAQIFTTSLVFTLLLFIVVLGIGMKMWDYLSLTYDDAETTRELELLSVTSCDLLVSTPGSPHNWSVDGVDFFGLSSGNNVIDPLKLELFNNASSTNYSFVREKLDIEGYDFSYRLVNGSEVVYSYNWSFDFSRELSKAERIVIFNGEPMIFELVVRK